MKPKTVNVHEKVHVELKARAARKKKSIQDFTSETLAKLFKIKL